MWVPQRGPQTRAYYSEAFETLYGGQAGGGKSDLLLGLARQEHKYSLLLRRTYPELEDSLILRAFEFYGERRFYNGSRHDWSWPGRRVRFGHMEQVSTVHRYQSAAFDLIGFDELTGFPRAAYMYMLSRARTTIKGQRVQVVGCTNPGGEGNDWVMERWAAWLDPGYNAVCGEGDRIGPAQHGELRWYVQFPSERRDRAWPDGEPFQHEGKLLRPTSRTFIPAELEDNPQLVEADPDYPGRLQSLPEPYRSQLAEGDWQAGLTDDAYQIVPTAWITAAIERGRKMAIQGYPTTLGVDVARGGDDQTVIAQRYSGPDGDIIGPLIKIPGRATPNGQSVLTLILAAAPAGTPTNIDVIGIGASVYDLALGAKLSAYGVNVAEGSRQTDKSGRLKFTNVRAEGYWRLREALSPSATRKLALPDDRELLNDLRATRWKMSTSGVSIEKKEDIKTRIMRSPDCADAVVLALFDRGPSAIII